MVALRFYLTTWKLTTVSTGLAQRLAVSYIYFLRAIAFLRFGLQSQVLVS